jgi:hypothetical protein
MAITIQWGPNGPVSVTCDTPAEAKEVLRQDIDSRHPPSDSNGARADHPPTSPVRAQATTDERARTALEQVNDNVRQLLSELVKHPNGVDATELSRSTGIEIAAFGGILGSLSRAAKKSHLGFGHFLESEARFEGQRRYRWMTPTKLLIENRALLHLQD